MHIDSRLPYELLALETALAACSRGLEAEANEIEVRTTRQPLGRLRKAWQQRTVAYTQKWQASKSWLL